MTYLPSSPTGMIRLVERMRDASPEEKFAAVEAIWLRVDDGRMTEDEAFAVIDALGLDKAVTE